MTKKTLKGMLPALLAALVLASVIAIFLGFSGSDDAMGSILRALAMSGLVASFLACLSSLFAVELAKKTGLPFLAIHHGWALAVALMVPVHAGLALWRLGPDMAAYLAFDSYGSFLWAGRAALLLFLVGAAAGILRAALGRRWRIVHALNWAAFIVASAHAQLGGPSFRAWPLRVLGILMALGLAAAFAAKRLKMAGKAGR